jgi:hypothetical protein
MDLLLKKRALLSLVRRKLEASNKSVSKNPATKNQLYEKIL